MSRLRYFIDVLLFWILLSGFTGFVAGFVVAAMMAQKIMKEHQ